MVSTEGRAHRTGRIHYLGRSRLPDEQHGWLVHTKIILKSYFDNASGLRTGAPVRLSGVDIGNVSGSALFPMLINA